MPERHLGCLGFWCTAVGFFLMYCCRFFFRTHLGFSLTVAVERWPSGGTFRSGNFDLELVQLFLRLFLPSCFSSLLLPPSRPSPPWLADTFMTSSLNYPPLQHSSSSSWEVVGGHDCSTEKELMANLLNGVFKLVSKCRVTGMVDHPRGIPEAWWTILEAETRGHLDGSAAEVWIGMIWVSWAILAVLHFQQGPCLVKPLYYQLGLI